MNATAKENEQLLNEILVIVNRLKIRNLLYQEVSSYEQTENASSTSEVLGKEKESEKA